MTERLDCNVDRYKEESNTVNEADKTEYKNGGGRGGRRRGFFVFRGNFFTGWNTTSNRKTKIN